METYQEFAVKLAKDAGKIMKDNFGLGLKREWKADDSPVTAIDKEINTLVLDRISGAFPEHSILAEEGSKLQEGSRYTWACDPIDGTVPYSSAIPISTFSLALVEDGVPILGVIYDPFSDRLFTAEKGQGTYLNGTQVHVSNHKTLKGAYVDVESRHLIPLLTDLFAIPAKGVKYYCITCPGALVACGEFEAALFAYGKAWDVAALKILVEESGGKVTDIYGKEQRYDRENLKGGIISNGLVHAALLEMTAKYFPAA